jgi:hypothetical protein
VAFGKRAFGREILKVGPDVFAAALKKRLAAPSTKEKLFTWNDVFEDIGNPSCGGCWLKLVATPQRLPRE